MQIQKIGKRGTMFSFDFEFNNEPISVRVYVIDAPGRRYVFDTALGPGAIQQVADHFGPDFWEKPLLVVNSHGHFDHFWGNCAFKDHLIVAHSLCREEILKPVRAQFLHENPGFQMGKVAIVPPILTFDERLVFPDDQVEFIHTPGHSRDGISGLDHGDGVLLVGDNVGLPIPSLYPGVPLDRYIQTLEYYLKLEMPTIIASHCGAVAPEVLEDHLVYLKTLKDGDAGVYETGEYKAVHEWNLRILEMGQQ